MTIDPQAEINYQLKKWISFFLLTVVILPFAFITLLKSAYINKIIFSETIASGVYYYSEWTKFFWNLTPRFDAKNPFDYQTFLSAGIIIAMIFCASKAGSAWNSIEYWSQVKKEVIHNSNVKKALEALDPESADYNRKFIQIIENNRQGHTYIQKDPA